MVNDIEGFEVSTNGRYILVYRDSEPIYRRSFTASYYVYEIRTRMMMPLSEAYNRQRAPLMSDDGRMVAFVAEDNNIYIKKVDYNSEVAVTKDGAVNKVLNGVPDWVYEEEFATSRSMVWSPDNLQLCYLRYDETEVPTYTLPIYEGTCNPQKQYALYPGMYEYKYPVAGAPNSKVSLHAYDVETRKVTPLPLPDQKIEYIPRIAFGPTSDCLMVTTLNRDQNHIEIYNLNPRSSVAKSVYTDKTKAWVEEMSYDNIVYGKDYFIVMSGKSGFNHLYKYSYNGALQKTLTQGDFDVTRCYGYDAAGNLYYQAAHPTPMDRVVYKIDVKGVTTAISATSGSNTADFAPDMTIAMMSHSDVTTPPVYTINTSSGKKLRTVLDNTALATKFGDLPVKEFFTMISDGVTLNGYMIKPSGASASNKCPVIMSQYSGPGSQQVLNRWGVDWEQYFVKQGYGVICVDGRGTGGRGRAFMDVVYRQLGHYETIDQVNAARYAASLPWVDKDRIG
ncbi:MAG: DPP IV N-terminal domain-containing protein, partial [Muribaculaceae bacterium]|nr:DPP IV N-terminal domain-containing protein [Muribaculaceae bacterium]